MSKLLRGLLLGATLLAAPSVLHARPAATQSQIDAFAGKLGYHLTLAETRSSAGCPTPKGCLRLDLDLTMPKSLPPAIASGDFAIYASFVTSLLPLKSDVFDMEILNGDLVRFTPKPGVKLTAGTKYTLRLISPGNVNSPYFLLPNAYVVADGIKPRVIASARTGVDAVTGEETLPFVTSYSDEARQNGHPETPWLTPERLFEQTASRQAATASAADIIILPTPVKAERLGGPTLDLTKGVAVKLSGVAAADLAPALAGLRQADGGVPLTVTIVAGTPESYRLTAENDAITITAADAAGASYALRSLTQQAAHDKYLLKPLRIEDAPRFGFRGLHLDVARNFHPKAQIFKVVEQMAAYKLNKLHLHLGEDEAWRLEIASLPELTDIGSKRCHDLAEDTCLLPQLGAGPDADAAVNGYLTRADYIELLKFAKARQIEVIPSFDMPGHSRSSVRSMEARARRLIAEGKPEEAARFRLVDPNDKTVYDSIQSYNDNTLDVCLDSTYAFIDTVLTDIQGMHAEAGAPLHIYHLGLDETAGAWKESPACKKLMAEQGLKYEQLGPQFVTRVTKLLTDKGIAPAGWSDGMGHVDPAKMPKNTQSNTWGGLFSGGVAEIHKQANQGWNIVLSNPDVLYLDMPNAADGHERGYDWASRATDLYKIFAFMPENLPANGAIMTTPANQPGKISDTVPLTPGHTITGMQGQLWSEVVRTPQIADYMLFPRTLAVAERAWHKASWEPAYVPGKAYAYDDGSIDKAAVQADWQDFQARVSAQLPALDQAGVRYRLPIPGARVQNGKLEANAVPASLKIQYRAQGGNWTPYSGPAAVKGEVRVRTVSPDGKRFSREAVVK
ncbi:MULTISPECIES: family 20 glycosylhydrolase [Asticcacaulis]|uniref:family 20 glycosylhydrolase n=1 Tax=Asticcacaulis TaxID=76890 RepID=UPI001AE2072A|nr:MULTISPECIES: family 20 glycosylhydrolase [Asticcacaulis]MBP2160082.1 hexosaminidase [Asticcacaulis solisilvae]MDR6801127.1 hexosaminidase [Asticcacaulis sp. BE141]